MALWWPLDSVRVTGEFANSPEYYARFGQRGHNGIDLAAGVGTPVYAADSGVVDFKGWGTGHSWMGAPAGISILLRHPWGYTGYAHLSSTIIDRGQSVSKGQLIGYSGNTTQAAGGSLGPHLHFETLPPSPNFSNGYAGRVNPHTYGLEARGSAPQAAALAGHERQVKSSDSANRRVTPDRSQAPTDSLDAGAKGEFDGFIRGESIDGNNIWFRGKFSQQYFWSGCFTDTGTHDLTDLGTYSASTAAPAPAPKPVENVPASNTLKPLCDTIKEWNATADEIAKFTYETQPALGDMPLPDWITERHVEPGTEGYKKGRPGQPNHIVYHHAWTASLNGAVTTLSGKTDAPTANYVIKDYEVVSMVDEGDSPFTNGRIGSNIWAVTFELVNDAQTGVDKDGKPVFSAPSKKTLETAAYVSARAMIRRGWKVQLVLNVNEFGHGQVSKTSTSCPGETDLAYIERRTNEILAEYRHSQEVPDQPKPTEPVAPTEPTENKEPDMATEMTEEEKQAILDYQAAVVTHMQDNVALADLGNIISSNKTRKIVWAIYGITGIILAGVGGGLAAAQWIAPEQLLFVFGFYTAVAPAFSSLAIANISTKK